jgi:hypothetical protein
VAILPRSASGPNRIVLRSHGVNPTATHPISHQLGEVWLQRRPLISSQVAARQQRIQLMAEQ